VHRLEKVLLTAGVMMPVLYFGTVALSALFYPGYSHVTQYASELGSSQAPLSVVFNSGIVLTGAATIVAGVGFFGVALRLTGRRVVSALVGLSLALFGIALLVGAMFPMPDPRHGAFGLGVTVHVAPFLLATALWRRRSLRLLNGFLLAAGLVMLILLAVSMGVGGLVTRSNVGIFQRAYALTVFSWPAVAASQLLRSERLAARGAVS